MEEHKIIDGDIIKNVTPEIITELSANLGSDELTRVNKEWIDEATYKEMLERNKVAHPGDTILIGDMGQYFLRMITIKKQEQENAPSR